jgi:5'-3' exonuclease
MGIPSFFLHILKNRNYKNIHKGVKNGEINCDYFFLDYNGIVYAAYARVAKKYFKNNLSKNEIEKYIIEETVQYTKYLICHVVQPKKLTYIALDGPAPRAKMVQQRSRRYKTYYTKMIMQNEKKKLKIETNNGLDWDTSSNISPGTEFMQKLSNELLNIIKKKGFSVHNHTMQVLLSDSNIPGEGEHKFLPFIRTMRTNANTENAKIYLYGKDADLIVLGISTHKNNTHIIREVDLQSHDMKKMYETYEFVDVSIDNLKDAFYNDLTLQFQHQHHQHHHQQQTFDKIRIINDYIFLTFLVGNDFVVSLPYLKIKNDGLKELVNIYKNLKPKYTDYLIDYHPDIPNSIPILNISFFKELIGEMAKKEDFLMKNQQKSVDVIMSNKNDYYKTRRLQEEYQKSAIEIFQSRFEHLEVCSPDHPLYYMYYQEFTKIDYHQDYEIWKEQYYQYYLNIDKSNELEYYQIRKNIVENYFESIVFNLQYYFKQCPSWKWHYKFRISPLLSDVCYFLNNNLIDIHKIQFKVETPYTPFQQLMLIYPPQMDFLIPSVLRPIMNDDTLLCTQFYPIDFKIDVTIGKKIIYSEAILPEIDEDLLLTTVKKYEKKLNKNEKERNIVSMQPIMF